MPSHDIDRADREKGKDGCSFPRGILENMGVIIMVHVNKFRLLYNH